VEGLWITAPKACSCGRFQPRCLAPALCAGRWALAAALVSLYLLPAAASFLVSPAVLADGGAPNLAYVAGGGTGGNDVVVVDISARKVTGSISVGGRPAGVVLSTDGRYAYVTESSSSRLAIIDASTHAVTGTVRTGEGPTAVALDLSETPNLLFVADSGGDSVTVIDPSTLRVQATIPVGRHPSGVAVALPGTGISETGPHDAEIYVANSLSDTVSVISAATMRVIATIPVPGGPLAVSIPQSGGIAYVGTGAGTVLAISLASHRLAGVVLRAGTGPCGTMDYDAVTEEIFVPKAGGNVLDVLTPVALDPDGQLSDPLKEPAHILPIGGQPVAVAITFEGSYGFVAQRALGTVTMFDADTSQVQATIRVGGAPLAIVTGAYPPPASGQTSFPVSLAVAGLLLAAMAVTIVINARHRRVEVKR
jgi:YVTN family beta-propeller protein